MTDEKYRREAGSHDSRAGFFSFRVKSRCGFSAFANRIIKKTLAGFAKKLPVKMRRPGLWWQSPARASYLIDVDSKRCISIAGYRASVCAQTHIGRKRSVRPAIGQKLCGRRRGPAAPRGQDIARPKPKKSKTAAKPCEAKGGLWEYLPRQWQLARGERTKFARITATSI